MPRGIRKGRLFVFEYKSHNLMDESFCVKAKNIDEAMVFFKSNSQISEDQIEKIYEAKTYDEYTIQQQYVYSPVKK